MVAVASRSMLAAARKHVTDHVTRAANDDFINGGSCTRTKYAYDNALRITGIADGTNSNLSWMYGYDTLDRVNSANTPGQAISFTYDSNGNRLTQGGSATETLNISSTSNILSTVSGGLSRTYSYDASGNTLAFSGNSFTYNDAGRISATNNGTLTTSYVYNAFGQRIKKSNSSATTYSMYDEAGHLLGEYDGSGNLIEEIVWMGDTPVATVRIEACGLSIFYIHTDHLNTPRRITRRSTADIVWSWESDPFGSAGPNQNPSGLGTFAFNLRFPGQYYDSETGLNQNYFRDYDPSVGRYVESDPIGLKAGINTYGYVRGSPVMHGDFFGLLPGDCYLTQNAAGADAVNDINWQSIQSNTEYAGRIYENPDGTYSYTAPTPGTAITSNPGPLTPSTVGSYHTHGGQLPGSNGEAFSYADIGVSILEGLFIQGYVAYLGTPDGVIKAIDPHTYNGEPQNTSPADMQIAQFWNLPYPTPGQAVPCACDNR